MKKIYNSPAIETTEVRSMFALCEGSEGGSGQLGGLTPAPERIPL